MWGGCTLFQAHDNYGTWSIDFGIHSVNGMLIIDIMHILVKGYSPFLKKIYLLNIQGTKLEKEKEINAKG